ncbi:hypothetical protein ACLB9X_31795 [Streptomyces sp. 5K101]|uniref:hypothetical protein n=1 Tax=Streptomyces sp. 5K101 TaxID=3390037 RepID=UPI003974992C
MPLLPDLSDRLPPPLPRPPGLGAEKYQLVQAARTVLGALGPAALVIEDVHWVDQATRELLLLLARDLPEQLALVLTYRGEDLPGHTPVLGVAYRRPPGTGGAEIHLLPLSEREVRPLATAALGPRAAAAVGGVLYERSAGLPLVAEEDLITLARHGRYADYVTTSDYVTELQHAEVPRELREAVTERLSGLSPRGLAVLEAAAVAVPATETLLSQVSGLDTEEGAQGLSEALGTRVLQESCSTRYAFRHVLVSRSSTSTSPGTGGTDCTSGRSIPCVHCHRPRGSDRTPHLALGDRDSWLQQAEAAVDQAITLGDEGTAAALLHRILTEERTDPGLRGRAALALARITVNAVDYTGSAAVLRRILADPQLSSTIRGEIRLSLGILMVHHAGDRAGFGEVEQAVDELADNREAASRAMAVLATNEQDGASEQAHMWMERARDALRGSSDAAARAALDVTRFTLMARNGDPAVWALVEEVPRHSDDPAVLRQTVRTLFNVGEIAIELGHTERAAALLEESRKLAQHLGYPRAECYSRTAQLRLDGLAGTGPVSTSGSRPSVRSSLTSRWSPRNRR